jgi:hypothetical protein
VGAVTAGSDIMEGRRGREGEWGCKGEGRVRDSFFIFLDLESMMRGVGGPLLRGMTAVINEPCVVKKEHAQRGMKEEEEEEEDECD